MKEVIMMDCIFCKIIDGSIPSKKVYEDKTVMAFYDTRPQAPVHFLVVSKQHINSVGDITVENSAIVAHIYEVIASKAKELGLEKGFRVITNVGEHGAQTVKHLHFHVLGKVQLSEKIS